MRLNYIDNIDCLEGLKEIPDKSVDLIVTDPPYGTTRNSWDRVVDLAALWDRINRVIKPDGAVLIFSSQPFTTTLNYSCLKKFRYEWIWVKNTPAGFQLANKRPLKKHEIISVFYEKQPTYHPQGLEPYGRINRRQRTGSNWREMKSDCYVQKFTNYPTQLLEIPSDKEKLHPTQKPIALIEYMIKTYSNPGDVVLDPFMGSGTTAVACIRTGRNYIGYELSAEYCQIAEKRIADAIDQLLEEAEV